MSANVHNSRSVFFCCCDRKITRAHTLAPISVSTERQKSTKNAKPCEKKILLQYDVRTAPNQASQKPMLGTCLCLCVVSVDNLGVCVCVHSEWTHTNTRRNTTENLTSKRRRKRKDNQQNYCSRVTSSHWLCTDWAWAESVCVSQYASDCVCMLRCVVQQMHTEFPWNSKRPCNESRRPFIHFE